MCIISDYVENVANTKILVAVNPEKTRQFTCYSNVVNNSTDGNAMILPVPYPNSVKFHDLSDYKNIFDDCKNCFTSPQPKSRGMTLSTNSWNMSDGVLEVFNVGSYQVSLGMSLADLDRVNGSVFRLSPGCGELLKKDYSHPSFGFIICKLSKGEEEYHPLGYSHEIFGNNIFIPTKHYHEHAPTTNTNKISNFDMDNDMGFGFSGMGMKGVGMGDFSMNSSFGGSNYASFDNNWKDERKIKSSSKRKHNEWDHDIYLYNVTMASYDAKRFKSDKPWNNKDLKNKEKINFNFGNLTSFEKYEIRDNGSLMFNNDLIGTAITTQPSSSSYFSNIFK